MPVKYPQCAGEPYRPSNGTEGMIFADRWCCHCKHDQGEEGCELIFRAMAFSVGEEGYPIEWVYDHAGVPMCAAYLHKHTPDGPPPSPRCPHTADLFGGKP